MAQSRPRPQRHPRALATLHRPRRHRRRRHRKEPKGTSRRTIAIGPTLAQIINLHRARQEGEKTRAGWHYQDNGYVFCNRNGSPYHPKTFTDRFRALCAQIDIPDIALHDGRHTSATIGADHGIPIHAMQQRLGHTNGTTTMYYTHIIPDTAHRTANIMENTILHPTT